LKNNTAVAAPEVLQLQNQVLKSFGNHNGVQKRGIYLLSIPAIGKA